jgi:hypothetical protein
MRTSDSAAEPGSQADGVMLDPDGPLLPHSCKCGKRWAGSATAHCPSCHETFTVVSAFDRHRRGGSCVDPAGIGLHSYQRIGYVAWGHPDSGRDRPGRVEAAAD